MVHRFFHMWQQSDCAVAQATASDPAGCRNDLYPFVGIAPLRKDPSHDAPLLTEALCGEHVTIYETDEEGWAWGQLESDKYVGWLPAVALLAPQGEATHKVAVRSVADVDDELLHLVRVAYDQNP